MKIFLALVSCLLVGAVTAQTWVAGTPEIGTPRRGGRVDVNLTVAEVCEDASRYQFFCNNKDQCHSKKMFFCLSATNAVEIDCGDGFCVGEKGEAECVDKPSSCGGAVGSSAFTCLEEGFFPDPSDCRRYFYCLKEDNGDINAYPQKCVYPYVFDPSGPKNQFCRRTNGNSRYCTTVQCDITKPNVNIAMKFSWFPSSRGVYVVNCLKGIRAPPLVFRCPAGTTADLTPTFPKCKLVCNRDAMAAFPGDSTKHFQCVYNPITRKWNSEEKQCVPKWFFDEKLGFCTPAPACTNGANNPPLCNTCFGNKKFADGLCTPCLETQIVDPSTSKCKECAKGATYDASVKKCACTDADKVVDDISFPAVPECKTCTPDITTYNITTKACDCKNKATDVWASCTICPTGHGMDDKSLPAKPECKPCPTDISEYNNATNACVCKNRGVSPWTTTPCLCAGGRTEIGVVCT